MSTTSIVHRANTLSRAAKSHSFVRVRHQSFHASRAAQAIMMPALSPMMTEGTITRWKKKEGEAFLAGDVLLQVESDVAFLDVRAEMPGILGKILIPDGTTNVPVEQVIALVARDSQELARLRPPTLPKLVVPPNPMQATVRSAHTPTSASSQAPTPIAPTPRHATTLSSLTNTGNSQGKRVSLHYHHPLSTAHLEHPTTSLLHSSTHRTPSPYERHHSSETHAGAATVRGMVIDHHQVSCPASASTCDSASFVGCGAQTQNQTAQAEFDGADLRRKIMSSLSRSGSRGPKGSGSASNGRCATTDYFDGIL